VKTGYVLVAFEFTLNDFVALKHKNVRTGQKSSAFPSGASALNQQSLHRSGRVRAPHGIELAVIKSSRAEKLSVI
jgi:hypothetical protein